MPRNPSPRPRWLRLAGVVVPATALVLGMTAPSSSAPGDSGQGSASSADRTGHDPGSDDHRAITLWYDEPATDWESQSLPIGNGATGASIFGGVETERLQFNEKTLWTGGPGSAQGYNFGNWDTPRPGAIGEVQERIDAEQRVSPSWVADKLGQPKSGYGAYQTLGDLELTRAVGAPAVSDYRRYLDIAARPPGVSFEADGVTDEREYFASAADDVIVARLSSDKPGEIGFTGLTHGP